MSAAPVIVVSPEELRRIVREAVRAELEAVEAPPEWLDSAGAAELLGVHVKTVQKLVRTQGLPAHRVGEKILRFSRPALLDWMKRRAAGEGA